MDSNDILEQVIHIVSQLERPRRFKERVLCLDNYNEKFIRQHCIGSYTELIRLSNILKKRGWIDRIIIAPTDIDVIQSCHLKWFGIACEKSHTHKGSPSFVHCWGLNQINTRYVLMCDVDIFVGRRNFEHDYLGEMLAAVNQKSVMSVGFNIPFPSDEPFHKYEAPEGGYVPETRCGLLDLDRIYKQFPLPNYLTEGSLSLTWYRSLEATQQKKGYMSLRGGSSSTYYAHPQNNLKSDTEFINIIRDAFYNNNIPSLQYGNWDIVGSKKLWSESKFEETINYNAINDDFSYVNKRNTRYPINMHRLEIDITYRCQLRCSNCSRGCTQFPVDSDIHISQIIEFLDSSFQQKRFWNKVRILGGEPTLHPNFIEIIEIMYRWFEKNSPQTDVKVVSNGAGKIVREKYYQIPELWRTESSFKDGSDPDYFDPVNIAPKDLSSFQNEDFTKACWVAMECGMALTPNGYFPCSVAGAIDRMFKINGGRLTLPKDTEDMQKELSKYCSLCGHFLSDNFLPRDKREKLIGNPRSKTWISILNK